jgi:hypothetical protein
MSFYGHRVAVFARLSEPLERARNSAYVPVSFVIREVLEFSGILLHIVSASVDFATCGVIFIDAWKRLG